MLSRRSRAKGARSPVCGSRAGRASIVADAHEAEGGRQLEDLVLQPHERIQA